MGGREVQKGLEMLNAGGIPTFQHPDAAARTFSMIWKQTRDMMMMYQTPEMTSIPGDDCREKAISILKKAQDEGKELLTEAESKLVLKSYGIPIVETVVCQTVEEAVKAAHDVTKYPCVVKLNSETLTHKADVGGVKLNLKSKEEVSKAFNDIKKSVVEGHGAEHFQGVTVQPMINLSEGIELILGSSVDAQFGPLVLFGTGGSYVEIFKDRSLGIPPLDATLARRMIEDTKIYTALQGFGGLRFQKVDLATLESTLAKFSQMICDLSDYVSECDINPLLALKNGGVALDARVALLKKGEVPAPLAIRPYPSKYTYTEVLSDKKTIKIRPITAADAPKLKELHEKLSTNSVKQRYLAEVSLEHRIASRRMIQTCCSDYDRLIALVAFNEADEMVGMVRIQRDPSAPLECELKLVVRDDHQGRGIGKIFFKRALEVAKAEKFESIHALVLNENHGFLKLIYAHGFSATTHPENDSLIECRLKLT